VVEPEQELGGRQDEVGLAHSRRRCLALLRRPARETSQSDENAYYNTENREQAHVGVLLLACRHRPLAGIMRAGCFWVLSSLQRARYSYSVPYGALRYFTVRTVLYGAAAPYGALRCRAVFYGALRC
jgi:hypothetical protein